MLRGRTFDTTSSAGTTSLQEDARLPAEIALSLPTEDVHEPASQDSEVPSFTQYDLHFFYITLHIPTEEGETKRRRNKEDNNGCVGATCAALVRCSGLLRPRVSGSAYTASTMGEGGARGMAERERERKRESERERERERVREREIESERERERERDR